jgi:PAS domain S-box-containing protein
MASAPFSPTILCVDDEASGLYFRTLILESQGYKVIAGTSAPEGLNLFKANQVDLVITDHLMGRATGTVMAAEMKRLKPGVPIILLSGTTDIPEGMENADVFLPKTEGPEKLLEKVQELLTRDRESSTQDGRKPEAIFSPEMGASQALLAAIVEGSEDAVFSKTLNGIVTSWNKAAERMYGYRGDEIIGKPVSVLLPSDRPNEVHDILQRLNRGERIEHFETLRLAKNGRQLSVSLTVSPIRDSHGNIVGASTIARDITQIKMAEQALRNSEKLAVAGRMAATVAHEINNPVEAVSNILYLLENSTQLDDTARQFVRAAQTELRRIGQITKLTLGFYRGGEHRKTQVRITELIDDVLTLYGRQIESLGIAVRKRYRSAGIVNGDAGELRQVFSNLIVNAVDALSKTGDQLSVHVADFVDWRNPNLRGARTVVGDNGPGIASEHRARLFEPFYTTKGEKGTGLGLWVSRGIIEKHGGSIRFRSSSTSGFSGTCFSVFLPFAYNAS